MGWQSQQTRNAMTSEVSLGQLAQRYELVAVAGSGGMGVVYKAVQRSLSRTVALKVLRDDIAWSPEYRERFLREAQLAAAVDHPHVVTVFDMGDEEGRLFITMQWIDGQDLRQVLERAGRLTPERAVLIASQLAGAVDAVHSVHGLIHRDIKPANVLLRQVGGREHAYLTDFGLAKPSTGPTDHFTKTGLLVGTNGYLSPEQIKGEKAGPRSDLYALGCVFFEALTGRRPFEADNEVALLFAHVNDPRPTASAALPSLGTRYDELFAKALAIDPADRFASGREFAEALREADEGQPAAVASTIHDTPHEPTALGPPPASPIPPGSTPPAPLYPAYGYITPIPPPTQPGRSGNPLALILLGLIALAGIAVGALAAGGVFSHTTSTSTQTITRAGNTSPISTAGGSATSGHSTSSPAGQTSPPVQSGSTGGGGAASGTTDCGNGVSVGPNTSCGFALNVQSAYDQTSGGDQTVTAFSPATGLTYMINCTGGSPHVCTGGTTNDASVYFTGGPSGSPVAPSSPSGPSTAGLHACDPNISANQNTSCPFAENVFQAYANNYQSNGQQSNVTITAYSPVTNQSYTMDCTTDGVTVNCAGTTNNFVTFSLHAVQVY